MKKFLAFSLFILLLSGFLAACSDEGSEADSGTPENNNEQQETESFPLTITDALDKEMTIEDKPERIVSVMPSNTEIAFKLGLEDEIVGVSDNDDYPKEAQEKEKVGGMELNVEKIISLEPDLVLAHASAAQTFQKAFEQLRDADIKIYVVRDAQQIDETYETIQNIGEITGTNEKAEKIVSNMKESFADIREKLSDVSEDERKSVFFEVAPAPEMFTAGKNTFFNELLDIINADNASKKYEGWTEIDPEAIVAMDPDVIITTYGTKDSNPEAKVLDRDGWEDMKAIKEEQVYNVNSDLVSRPGPRLAKGAKEIAKVVYPEIFEE